MQRNKHSIRIPLSTPAKHRILKRDWCICRYCGSFATQVDHIVPYAFSQDNSDSNLVAACVWCNSHASSFVFDTLDAKRTYLQNLGQRRKRPGIAFPLSIQPLIKSVLKEANAKQTPESRICAWCHNAFIPPNGSSKFCSRSCVSQSQKIPDDSRICPYCRQVTNGILFCYSDDCLQRRFGRTNASAPTPPAK